MDFVVVWAALPAALRASARPVAAEDYWGRGKLRKRLALDFFRAVLVARAGIGRDNNPLDRMVGALEQGGHLILFPEGTRGRGGEVGEFRAGLFHLARRFPMLEMIPVHLENLHRILPKGELLPVPILGTIAFGHPLPPPFPDESKPAFLTRARQAVCALASRA
jgi:1-acyl-sn-glycerol-3-phosphate acyltransferase